MSVPTTTRSAPGGMAPGLARWQVVPPMASGAPCSAGVAPMRSSVPISRVSGSDTKTVIIQVQRAWRPQETPLLTAITQGV